MSFGPSKPRRSPGELGKALREAMQAYYRTIADGMELAPDTMLYAQADETLRSYAANREGLLKGMAVAGVTDDTSKNPVLAAMNQIIAVAREAVEDPAYQRNVQEGGFSGFGAAARTISDTTEKALGRR